MDGVFFLSVGEVQFRAPHVLVESDVWVGGAESDRKSNMQYTRAFYLGEPSVQDEIKPYNLPTQTHLRVKGGHGRDVTKVLLNICFPDSLCKRYHPYLPFLLMVANVSCLLT